MDQPYAIVVGASAGGVSALVGVVLHVGSQYSILPELMSVRGPLRAVHARNGERLVPGQIFVAPPDHHMLFTPDGIQLNRGPRENHARPAIDPLFRSAALHWRDRAIGVVLTGDLDDGTAGLAAIKDCGGTAIVQDPATAFEPSMPASALANVAVDHCLPLAAIGRALAQRVGQTAAPVRPPVPDVLLLEQAVFEGREPRENLQAVAGPSSFTCPDCGGPLWELGRRPALALPLPQRPRLQRRQPAEPAGAGRGTGHLERRALAPGTRAAAAAARRGLQGDGRRAPGAGRAARGRPRAGPDPDHDRTHRGRKRQRIIVDPRMSSG